MALSDALLETEKTKVNTTLVSPAIPVHLIYHLLMGVSAPIHSPTKPTASFINLRD